MSAEPTLQASRESSRGAEESREQRAESKGMVTGWCGLVSEDLFFTQCDISERENKFCNLFSERNFFSRCILQ